MADIEGKDYEQYNVPGTSDDYVETTFGGSGTDTTTYVSDVDAISQANDVLKQADLPDIDTIIKTKAGAVSPQFRDLLAETIEKNKPKSESEVNASIQEVITRAKSQLPDVPMGTPGVDQHTQNKIGVVMSRLSLFSGFDHSKFVALDNDGLAVKTSIGEKRLTQVSNPHLFLRDPGIPKPEYRTLFGIEKEEYQRRLGENNKSVVQPVDAKLDDEVRILDNFKERVLSLGSSAKEAASDIVDRIKDSRREAEFEYIQMAEMSDADAEREGLLPYREIVGIDKSFKTIEGQIQLAVAKAADAVDQIKLLEDKENKTPEDITRLQRLRDELDGHNEVLSVLKGRYADEISKMRKQRNIVLGITAALAVGGILTAIFEAVANALGSDAAKELIPKSTDPKDIAESGIGKLVKQKLEHLAAYFHDQYLNSSGASKAFWHMMENAVKFIEEHLWLLIASALAVLAYELSK